MCRGFESRHARLTSTTQEPMKNFTHQEACFIGRQLSAQLKLSAETWEVAMRVLPLSSPEYKAICAAGKEVQSAYHKLLNLAEDRWGVDNDATENAFSANTHYGFN